MTSLLPSILPATAFQDAGFRVICKKGRKHLQWGPSSKGYQYGVQATGFRM